MILSYLPIAVLLLFAILLAGLVVIIGDSFGPKNPNRIKHSTYESGMTPMGVGTRRQPIRYYRIAMLFILFDIEVIFFLPWAVVFRQLGMFGLIEMAIFIAVVLVGYVYAWKKGALEWD